MSGDAVIDARNVISKVTGTIRRVLYRGRDDSFTILEIEHAHSGHRVVILGETAGADVGESVYAEGRWHEDPAWGRRLKAYTLRVSPPQDAHAIEQYLAGGSIPGIGKALARRLHTRFGEDLAGILSDQPKRLAEVKGISEQLAKQCGKIWRERQKGRDLVIFFQTHGLHGTRGRRIIDAYGDQALERIMADPYRLARDIKGIGFATADSIALGIGMSVNSNERLTAALVQALQNAETDGHTALTEATLLEQAALLLEIDPQSFDLARLGSGLICREAVDGTDYVWQKPLFEIERVVAHNLARILAASRPNCEAPAPCSNDQRAEHTVAQTESDLAIELTQTQREAVRQCLLHRIFIVTGGPGTGKTTILRAVRMAFCRTDRRIMLAAPTGRAAKRLSEATGDDAQTLHRLLEADPDSGFHRNKGRPLELDVLIIDESSMIDIYLINAVLDALPEAASLILVGDANQLPPVGPGLVLADLMRSGAIPFVQLNEIFRQAADSAIVQNAHLINAGKIPIFNHEAGADLFGVRARGPDDAVSKVIELVTKRIPAKFGFDPADDIQVLCPVNRGAVGTESLNVALQTALNPTSAQSIQRYDRTFTQGDKVMQIENDYNRDVYNGDIGRITAIETQSQLVVVKFDSGQQTYGFDELASLVPAYAVTVHKSQGSEYRAVVLVLLRQHGRMLRRNLLYTAVTRGRELVVLVTDNDALERAIRNTGDGYRTTFLAKRLQECTGLERPLLERQD